MALEHRFDVRAEVGLVVDVARSAVHRAAHVRECTHYLSSDPAHRTVDLPAKIDEPRPSRMQKDAEEFPPVDTPAVRKLERSHLSDLFVRSLGERLRETLHERAWERSVCEACGASLDLVHR